MRTPKSKQNKRKSALIHYSLSHPQRAIMSQWVAIGRAIEEVTDDFKPDRNQVYILLACKLVNGSHKVFTRRMVYNVLSFVGCLSISYYQGFLNSYNPLIKGKMVIPLNTPVNSYDPVRFELSLRAETFLTRVTKHWLKLSTNDGWNDYIQDCDEHRAYSEFL
jgi:hypothetical protein